MGNGADVALRHDSQLGSPGICGPEMAGQNSSWSVGHSGGGCLLLSVSLRELRLPFSPRDEDEA
jgi:hypothetical protein